LKVLIKNAPGLALEAELRMGLFDPPGIRIGKLESTWPSRGVLGELERTGDLWVGVLESTGTVRLLMT
jgi:hypothetical protein